MHQWKTVVTSEPVFSPSARIGTAAMSTRRPCATMRPFVAAHAAMEVTDGITAGLDLYTDSEGVRWLTGCVPDDVAQHLIAGGFIEGGPRSILCVLGYTLVSKQLGN